MLNRKRLSRNIYPKTREECEALLAELIKEMKAEIQAEKERLKQEQSMQKILLHNTKKRNYKIRSFTRSKIMHYSFK